MESDWDFYLCEVESRQASIFLDLGYRDHAPLAAAEELIWVRVPMRFPRPDGLSSKEELSDLCRVEDVLCQAADTADSAFHYVGRATWDGNRDFYFYGPHRDIETGFAQAIQSLKHYCCEIGGRDDPDWQAYFHFLFPGPREYQTIQNGRVVRHLEECGDQLTTAREVQHWVYFVADEHRRLFIKRLPRTGCVVADEHDEGPEDTRYVVSVVKRHAVDVDTVNDEVLRLFDLAGDCRGCYDGWETSVVAAPACEPSNED